MYIFVNTWSHVLMCECTGLYVIALFDKKQCFKTDVLCHKLNHKIPAVLLNIWTLWLPLHVWGYTSKICKYLFVCVKNWHMKLKVKNDHIAVKCLFFRWFSGCLHFWITVLSNDQKVDTSKCYDITGKLTFPSIFILSYSIKIVKTGGDKSTYNPSKITKWWKGLDLR